VLLLLFSFPLPAGLCNETDEGADCDDKLQLAIELRDSLDEIEVWRVLPPWSLPQQHRLCVPSAAAPR